MKIRSLLLGSAALCGLATAGYAADLGVVTALDVCDYSGTNSFDGYLLGTTACAVAMTQDGHFGLDPGGHMGAKIDMLEDSTLVGSIGSDLGLKGYGGDPGDDIGVSPS